MERLRTAAEVAELLSVPKSWVYAEARAGRIPHIRVGRYRRFSLEAVEAWARAHEQGPASRASGVQPGG
jgi:excisionase family DNA binding protein